MQIVIDIPERVYGLLKYFESALTEEPLKCEATVKEVLIRSVINGTPLPKGHGRLIDMDKMLEKANKIYDETSYILDVYDMEKEVDVITEADNDNAIKMLDDGTLCITVDDYLKVKRVLVQDKNKWGGLYYQDDQTDSIIRCKDCKHYNTGFECLIEGYGIERDKNYYCADGKKKQEKDNADCD